tara:strand:- start:69239 stop:70918 length:1680 start_codon:yes stop_codon:yes gene_type:complete
MPAMYRQTLLSTLATALAALSFAGCPSGGASKPVQAPSSEGTTTEQAPATLVIGIVLDQMPSSVILDYAEYLPEDGVIRRAIEQGLYQERVRYEYAGTNTAPGHASIYTGEVPADHGIDRNDIYDVKNQRKHQIVDDGKSPVFGVEGSSASPVRMLRPTIGDALHKKSPESKVVSVSLKARAAVVSAGKSADFATWYDYRIPGFTTSNYYADAMPAWLSSWNEKNPVSARLTPWTAEDPELYQRVVGDDKAPGESDWYGLGITFPHQLATTEKPYKTFIAAPQSMEYLLEMTRTLVDQFQLGADQHPDLLMLSVSSTDYAGHEFGTASWEYLDVLIKTDRALGALVRDLESKAKVAVVITSDHGGTPLAELSLAAGEPGGRLIGAQMVANLQEAASKAFGEGLWFEAYAQPYLYMSEAAQNSDKLPELTKLVASYVAATPEIEAIIPASVARTLRNSESWLERDVANTVSTTAEALFVVPARGHVAISTADGLGTGHGTPWDSDREVPVLAFGVGVSKGHDASVVSQSRVAPTIAALLGLTWHLPAAPLTGAPPAASGK